MADTIKVAVRVRPFNNREKENKSKLVVRMEGNTTYLMNPETGKERSFAFDYSFWSHNKKDSHFMGQSAVFDQIGNSVLNNAFQGYNCTVLAYGQTGSGKSYSMVGEDNNDESFKSDGGDSRGMIPRLCEGIFLRIKQMTTENVTFTVEASMMEIYNEKLHDLLNPEAYGRGHGGGGAGELRIRESPTLGPYVEGLTLSAVKSFEDLMLLMAAGTRNRTIGATSMNHVSSRAHTIFTIILTQTTVDKESFKAMDKVSRINLVDLAGSERQGKAESTGDRLKEGCAINKSLSALGHCITLIASGGEEMDMGEDDSKATTRKKDKSGANHIPYRDSVLTWLLSESLGGNAKTIMIAAISPADFNYAETLSTLRYAWQTKQIKTRAVINEDPNERLIRELREEIMQLRRRLGGEPLTGDDNSAMNEQLQKSEEMIRNLNKTWEQRLKETEMKLKTTTTSSLQPMGGAIDAQSMLSDKPYLLNLHEDQALTKNLAFPLVRYTVFGTDPDSSKAAINPTARDEVALMTLKGVGLRQQHCVFEVVNNRVSLSIVDTGRVCINGKPLQLGERKEVKHNDRIVMGMNHVFVVCHPSDATMTPRRSMLADWTMAMEEMLAGMQQKFFDPREQEKHEAELNAKMDAIREKENMLELERQKYQRMLQEIENEYKQFNRRRDAKIQSRMAELEETLEAEGRLSDLEVERERLLEEINAESDDEMEALEVKKQRIIQQQLDVEQILQAQNEKFRVFKTAKENEKREISRAEEDIMHLIPLVDEANLMAEHMGKEVKYEVRLQSSVSPEMFEDPVTGQTTHKTHVEAAVSVIDMNSIHTPIWSYDKFMTRLYMMREAFEKFQQDPSTSTDREQDPFYDQGEAQEIGKAHLWLMGLCHFIDTEDVVPIISKTGEQEGKLNVKLLIAEPSGKPNPLYYRNFSSVERMLGHRLDLLIEIPGCQGIDPTKFTDVFARFRFYNDDSSVETKPFPKATSNPTMRFKRHITIASVDHGFITFLQSDALTVEVWGTALAPKAVPDAKGKAQTLRSSKSSFITRQKSNSLLGVKPNNLLPISKTLSLPRSPPMVEEKVVEEMGVKLREVEEERDQLKFQVETISSETRKIPVFIAKINDLEAENERLKAQIAELMATSSHQNHGHTHTVTKTVTTQLQGTRQSPSRRSVGGPPANTATSESSKRQAGDSARKSPRKEDLSKAHRERLDQMKKRFGS